MLETEWRDSTSEKDLWVPENSNLSRHYQCTLLEEVNILLGCIRKNIASR